MDSNDKASLSDWLALREAADSSSRSKRLTTLAARILAGRDPVHVLDLGTGTGSNLRYLVPHLPSRQVWTVVDRDAQVLRHLQDRTASWGATRGYDVVPQEGGFIIQGGGLECQVTLTRRDLQSVDAPSLFEGQQLVTASALLDLVSESWLRTLAAQVAAAGAAALFTITYDGRSPCAPADPDDDIVRELFNRHQRTDKGLGGPAAGPDAAAAAVQAFESVGYHVERERSDWVIEPDARDLQRELIEGWAFAATEMAPEIAPQIANWRLRRLRFVDEGGSLLVVGHEDVFAARQP